MSAKLEREANAHLHLYTEVREFGGDPSPIMTGGLPSEPQVKAKEPGQEAQRCVGARPRAVPAGASDTKLGIKGARREKGVCGARSAPEDGFTPGVRLLWLRYCNGGE